MESAHHLDYVERGVPSETLSSTAPHSRSHPAQVHSPLNWSEPGGHPSYSHKPHSDPSLHTSWKLDNDDNHVNSSGSTNHLPPHHGRPAPRFPSPSHADEDGGTAAGRLGMRNTDTAASVTSTTTTTVSPSSFASSCPTMREVSPRETDVALDGVPPHPAAAAAASSSSSSFSSSANPNLDEDRTFHFGPSHSPASHYDTVEGCYRYVLHLDTRVLEPLPLLSIPTYFRRGTGSSSTHPGISSSSSLSSSTIAPHATTTTTSTMDAPEAWWRVPQTSLPSVAPHQRAAQQEQWRCWQRLLATGSSAETTEAEEEALPPVCGDQPNRVRGHDRSQAGKSTTSASASPRRSANGWTPAASFTSGPVIPIECRWGLEVHQLDELIALHKVSFPIAYDLQYYEWFWNGSTISLVAYTTSDGLDQLENMALQRHREAGRSSEAFLRFANSTATQHFSAAESDAASPPNKSKGGSSNRSGGTKSTVKPPPPSRMPRFPHGSFLIPWDAAAAATQATDAEGEFGAVGRRHRTFPLDQGFILDPLSLALSSRSSSSSSSFSHRLPMLSSERRRHAPPPASSAKREDDSQKPWVVPQPTCAPAGGEEGWDETLPRGVVPRYEVFDPLPPEKLAKFQKQQQQQQCIPKAKDVWLHQRDDDDDNNAAPRLNGSTWNTAEETKGKDVLRSAAGSDSDAARAPITDTHSTDDRSDDFHDGWRIEHYTSLAAGSLRRRQRSCSVMVGLVSGQPTYPSLPPLLFPGVREEEEMFFVNPAQYIGAIAVSPLLRQCGVGGVLLSLYTECMYTQYPVRLRSFLHHRLQIREYHASNPNVSHARLTGQDTVRRENEDDLAPQRTTTAEAGRSRHGDHEETAESQARQPRRTAAANAPAAVSPSLVRLYLQDPSMVDLEQLTRRPRPGPARESLRQRFDKDSHALASPPHQGTSTRVRNDPAPSSSRRSLPHWRRSTAEEGAVLHHPPLSSSSCGTPPLSESSRIIALSCARLCDESNANPVVQYGYDGGVWLHCLASDKPLRRFYAKRGFKDICELPEYYEFGGAMHTAALLCYRPALPPRSAASKAPRGPHLTLAGDTKSTRYLEDTEVDSSAERQKLLIALRQNARAVSRGCQVPLWWMDGVVAPLIRNVGLVTVEEAQACVEERVRGSPLYLRTLRTEADSNGGGAFSYCSKIRGIWTWFTDTLSWRGRRLGKENAKEEDNSDDSDSVGVMPLHQGPKGPTRAHRSASCSRTLSCKRRALIYTGIFAIVSLLLTAVLIFSYWTATTSLNQRKVLSS